MQQQVGGVEFFERRAKRVDQFLRQRRDEADGVGETHARPVAEVHPAQRRIERRERLIGNERSVAARAREAG